MLIECTLKREAPIQVPIGNEIYDFEPDGEGRCVCEVYREDHIAAFLSCDALYRPLVDGETTAPAAPGAPKLDRKAIMAALKGTGIRFSVTAKTEDLRALLPARPKVAA
jgi:hypothetical protein